MDTAKSKQHTSPVGSAGIAPKPRNGAGACSDTPESATGDESGSEGKTCVRCEKWYPNDAQRCPDCSIFLPGNTYGARSDSLEDIVEAAPEDAQVQIFNLLIWKLLRGPAIGQMVRNEPAKALEIARKIGAELGSGHALLANVMICYPEAPPKSWRMPEIAELGPEEARALVEPSMRSDKQTVCNIDTSGHAAVVAMTLGTAMAMRQPRTMIEALELVDGERPNPDSIVSMGNNLLW